VPESPVASTYLSLNVHVIFATKGRRPLIADEWRGDLHAYLGGTLRGLGAHPFAIGGVADHVHLLAGLRGIHAVADLVREVKKASSSWASARAPGFAWQEGYAALSVRAEDVCAVADYIGRQEEHHRRLSSAEELRQILAEAGVEVDERFFD